MADYRAFKDSWSVNTFVKRYKRGEINFDNPIQRGIVWDKKMSSLYIHSLLYNILIYQKPFLISKKEHGWDVLDGKQRGTTFVKFINNEFALRGLQNEPKIMLNGEPYSPNGKFFKQLPEDLQMKILDFQIDIAMLEDAPVEIEALFFERSNSGKAMAKTDLARSRNRSIATVKEIAKHPIFKIMFSSKQLEKLPEDEIVVKTWQALNETEPNYSISHFNSLMQELDITEENQQEIIAVYNRVFAAYKQVDIVDNNISAMMMRKTHFLSYLNFVQQFESDKQFADWLLKFFGNVPEEYQLTTTNRTTSAKNISTRIEIIKQSIDKFLA